MRFAPIMSLLLLAGSAFAGPSKGFVIADFDQAFDLSTVLEMANEQAAQDKKPVKAAPVRRFRLVVKKLSSGREVWSCRDASGKHGLNTVSDKLKTLRLEKNLECVDLSGVKPKFRPMLKGRNLKGVDLSNAELKGANFAGADMTNANLRGTKLSTLVKVQKRGHRKTTMEFKTTFAKAKLVRANLKGADLSSSLMTDADLTGAVYNFATMLPFNQAEAAKRGMIKREPRGKGGRQGYRKPAPSQQPK